MHLLTPVGSYLLWQISGCNPFGAAKLGHIEEDGIGFFSGYMLPPNRVSRLHMNTLFLTQLLSLYGGFIQSCQVELD